MKFLETSIEINLNEIVEVENNLALKFPNEFREHYLEYNGGYPEEDTYLWKDGGETTFNTFFSILYEGFGLLEDVYESLVIKEKVLPIGVVPFATDDGGNFFCISTRTNDYAKIWYCNNDKFNIANPEESLILINETFNEFLGYCK